MLCQGPPRRRSETCSRAALGHSRYFWLFSATFSAYALARRRGRGSSAWLASVLPNASSCSCKKGEESALR